MVWEQVVIVSASPVSCGERELYLITMYLKVTECGEKVLSTSKNDQCVGIMKVPCLVVKVT